MKTTTFISIIAIFIFTTTFSTYAQRNRTTTRSYEVTAFSTIQSRIVGNITIRHADTFCIRAEGDEDLMSELRVYVENETLFLKMNEERFQNGRGNNRRRLQIDISVPASETFRVSTNGISNITGEGIEFSTIRIDALGVGRIDLNGIADNLHIDQQGVGNINTENLIARSVTISSQGIGNVRSYASESIRIQNDGIGSVSFFGNPERRSVSRSGIGRIRER